MPHHQSWGLLLAAPAQPPSKTQPILLPALGCGPCLAPPQCCTLSYYLFLWYVQQFLSACERTQCLPSLKTLPLPTFPSSSCLLFLPFMAKPHKIMVSATHPTHGCTYCPLAPPPGSTGRTLVKATGTSMLLNWKDGLQSVLP